MRGPEDAGGGVEGGLACRRCHVRDVVRGGCVASAAKLVRDPYGRDEGTPGRVGGPLRSQGLGLSFRDHAVVFRVEPGRLVSGPVGVCRGAQGRNDRGRGAVGAPGASHPHEHVCQSVNVARG